MIFGINRDNDSYRIFQCSSPLYLLPRGIPEKGPLRWAGRRPRGDHSVGEPWSPASLSFQLEQLPGLKARITRRSDMETFVSAPAFHFVGIDVSMDSLDAAFPDQGEVKSYPNNQGGFKRLAADMRPHDNAWAILEASG